jgi:hypothetical protein
VDAGHFNKPDHAETLTISQTQGSGRPDHSSDKIEGTAMEAIVDEIRPFRSKPGRVGMGPLRRCVGGSRWILRRFRKVLLKQILRPLRTFLSQKD